ncbi:putative methyltransferase BCDIN3D-like [Tropilaelaps mercedesae]|uniref:RNA methyltransferase n=1 Tax=Tropilaelaps mercedesae TaxID=418985 RepID=A0A1V9XJ39_9ACAR|nr:putative methyltransferase BCDIN3D-like [Tropilaelaps mercedesae]
MGAPDASGDNHVNQPGSIENISHGAGTSLYGNFHNYYEFNPPTRRLSLLGPNWPSLLGDRCTLTALDVGCNSGNLTIELHRQLSKLGRPLRTLGIDLDPVLIKRATHRTRALGTLYGEVEFRTADFMHDAERQLHVDTFTADGRFDISFCFAVTMWVHLNHGDEGLRRFLRCVTSRCDYLLVEPQTWKCYRNASRRMRRQKKGLFQNIDDLQWKSNVLGKIDEFILNDCDMTVVQYFGVTEWGRPLTLYRAAKSV